MEEGEAKGPPQSTDEYFARLQDFLSERTLVVKGISSAHQDVLDDSITDYEGVRTLLEAAKEQLAGTHPQDVVTFLFSYVEELERIIARLAQEKREGVNYDA